MTPLRVTPETIQYYRHEAARLRAEAFRSAFRALARAIAGVASRFVAQPAQTARIASR